MKKKANWLSQNLQKDNIERVSKLRDISERFFFFSKKFWPKVPENADGK